METCFRLLLRDETRAEHERVDRLLSSFDIGRRGDLTAFLGIHRMCFSAMAKVAAQGGYAHRALGEMLHHIDADLAVLQATDLNRSAPTLGETDPLALDYMIEGSRLGTQVLKRRWAASRDPIVARASGYFSKGPTPGRWRKVCDDLSAVPAESARAARIIEDTQKLFALFHDVSSNWMSGQSLGKELIS